MRFFELTESKIGTVDSFELHKAPKTDGSIVYSFQIDNQIIAAIRCKLIVFFDKEYLQILKSKVDPKYKFDQLLSKLEREAVKFENIERKQKGERLLWVNPHNK